MMTVADLPARSGLSSATRSFVPVMSKSRRLRAGVDAARIVSCAASRSTCDMVAPTAVNVVAHRPYRILRWKSNDSVSAMWSTFAGRSGPYRAFAAGSANGRRRSATSGPRRQYDSFILALLRATLASPSLRRCKFLARGRDGLDDLRRRELEVVVDGGVVAETLRRRAQLGEIALHLRLRHERFHRIPTRAIIGGAVAEDLAATARHLLQHCARVMRRHEDVDALDRFEQRRIAFRH